MGAGLSTKQINSRIYRRLKSIEYDLSKAGVNSIYKRFELVFFEGDGITIPHSRIDGGFNIKFRISRASNGETAGFPVILTVLNGERKTFGWQEPAGSFEDGIAYIKAHFKGDHHGLPIRPLLYRCCDYHRTLERTEA